ncbi:unnamed protein product [Zymoseptoria tritici ST99CH_3D1]|nr:unnamed protein product [Zymoseptoria tritici ST99CH_3D1]
MRLLRLEHGSLKLSTHDEDHLPPYAILSHTWGSDSDEVDFDDVVHGVGKNKAGYAKIMFCAERALKDDLKDFWVDTCCINKASTAELSEAIISMFRYYQKSTKCYVYLSDVSTSKHDRDGMTVASEPAIRSSRWFTRGWTLQELLAPTEVDFWSRDKSFLGNKESLENTIHETTSIPILALRGAPLSQFSISERRRWAAKRETKKKEDKVYCQLGIFDVSMPVLYGEGEDKAFARLRAIIGPQGGIRQALSSVGDEESSDNSVEARRESVLASLSFEQIDARHTNIRDAQRATCEWLLQHPDFSAWANKDRHPGILWISGKPGAGKSTLMKFVLAHVRKTQAADEIVLDFFFNARGDEFEKTTLGMYRALLFHLLQKVPDLKIILDDVGNSNAAGSHAFVWSIPSLKILLCKAIGALGPRKLKIFVDALDECKEQEVRDMVEFLEELGEHEVAEESRLSICMASRHYPSIEVLHSWRLILEDEDGHADDLRKYIQRRLQAGKGKAIDEIRVQVQKKANGVFMWVVLVVGILNDEFRRGRIFAVKQRLREIPPELSELFRDMLQRDHDNMDDMLLCLQWILFAKRPLSREEFYYAMEAGLHTEDGGQWRPEPQNPEEVTAEVMERLVLSSSKGLAEVTRSKKAPVVQFIHESVRDFLLKDGGLQQLWSELNGDLASGSHERLEKCCSNYLKVDLSSHVDIPDPLPKAKSEQAKSLRQRVIDLFPFVRYAKEGILYHADQSTLSATQTNVLQGFVLDKWIHIHNILEPIELWRHSNEVNLLYVSAVRNLDRLIRHFKSQGVWLRLRKERYQFPVLAALAGAHVAALRALLGDDVEEFLPSFQRDPGFGKASRCLQHGFPLLWAASNKNESFAKFLLTTCKNKDICSFRENLKDGYHSWCLLGHALRHGTRTIVQLLIDAGVEFYAHSDGWSALHDASLAGNHDVVQLLLDKGWQVNAQGGHFGNALQAACHGGHEKTVQLLLSAGADANAQGGHYGNALYAAARKHDDEKVAQMLINAGADVNALRGYWNHKDDEEYHATALQVASFSGLEKMVRVLLEGGADVDACEKHGTRPSGTALQAASTHGHESVVKLLLGAGAEVDVREEYPFRVHTVCLGTALDAATCHGQAKVVQMLLHAGAVASGRETDRSEC